MQVVQFLRQQTWDSLDTSGYWSQWWPHSPESIEAHCPSLAGFLASDNESQPSLCSGWQSPNWSSTNVLTNWWETEPEAFPDQVLDDNGSFQPTNWFPLLGARLDEDTWHFYVNWNPHSPQYQQVLGIYYQTNDPDEAIVCSLQQFQKILDHMLQQPPQRLFSSVQSCWMHCLKISKSPESLS